MAFCFKTSTVTQGAVVTFVYIYHKQARFRLNFCLTGEARLDYLIDDHSRKRNRRRARYLLQKRKSTNTTAYTTANTPADLLSDLPSTWLQILIIPHWVRQQQHRSLHHTQLPFPQSSLLPNKLPSSRRIRYTQPNCAAILARYFAADPSIMAENIYDEIEIEDMTYDATLEIYHYPCPCGDRFEIGIADLRDGEEIAVCPSCSLMIRVVFEVVRISGYYPKACSAEPQTNPCLAHVD